MNREWLVPIVLGLVVAAGLYALPDNDSDEDAEPSGSHGSTTHPASPLAAPDILVPFASAQAVDGHEVTFLLLAPHGRAALEANLTARDAAFDASAFEWQGDRLSFLHAVATPSSSCTGATPCGGASPAPGWPLPTLGAVPSNHTPLLLRDGYNATKVTAYVFNETGALLGSNAPASETDRFTKHDDYFRLPSTAWYLGANATAPNGTAHLPGFAKPLVDRVRPELDGLPEEGVASVRSNAYVALYGTLFVTIRVDELVHAP